jgi:chorismate synthase
MIIKVFKYNQKPTTPKNAVETISSKDYFCKRKMASNKLGDLLTITSFGESHGEGVGAVIDGFPPGIYLDNKKIQTMLNERRPGYSPYSSPRKEADLVKILSGELNGFSTGAPITLWIANTDTRPQDYDSMSEVYRPGHADFTYQQKYGIRDKRGGGRSSARITAAWVAAGAVASLLLEKSGIEVLSYVKQIYKHRVPEHLSIAQLKKSNASIIRCPHAETETAIIQSIEKAKEEGDSLGGSITTHILNCPVGLGEPVFGKFQAKISAAIFSLNAVKGLQFGDGFDLIAKKGSETNDAFFRKEGKIKTKTNHSGGLLGGISNGMPIIFETAFKPTSTIGLAQETVNMDGEKVLLQATGRHDPCVVPRAVPIINALTYLVLADLWLLNRGHQLPM